MWSICREGVKQIQAATSVSARKAKESELGFRDSVFLYLPYFNLIRQTIVDPMHNLFSGKILSKLPKDYPKDRMDIIHSNKKK